MAAQTLAEASSASEGWSFSDVFKWQYLVTAKGESGPGGWDSVMLGDWCLHHCPRLPLARITVAGGVTAALVLGYAILPDGAMLEGEHRLRGKVGTGVADRIETLIEALAGRYIVLTVLKDAARVYADPACALGPVYHRGARRVAASTALLLRDAPDPHPDLPPETIAARDCRYLLGLTADRSVRRGRPNHYLDLADFSLHRHWPRADTPFERDEDAQKALTEEIGIKLGGNLSALSGRHSTALPVTGGTDSRLLLAASNPFLHQIGDFFVYNTNWSNENDVEIARILAERMCLPLRIISREAPAYQSALSWPQFNEIRRQRELRNGMEPDTAAPRSIRAMYVTPEVDLVLRGNVAEMTRALRWHPSVFDDPHNTGFALERLDTFRERAGDAYTLYENRFLDWKQTLPETALPRLYDFLHQELWLPHTNSVVYMADTRHFMINPFNDRRLIHLTMQVPPKVRRNRRIINRLIRAHAPEIRDVPFAIDLLRERRNAA